MNYNQLYEYLVFLEFVLAPIIFISLFFITAPYGKHLKLSWKPTIKSSWAWVIMELPAALILPIIFILYLPQQSLVSSLFLVIWLSHYGYRTFIYPFRTNNPNKPFPIIISLFGFIFNLMNGFINGYYLFVRNVETDNSWLYSHYFIFGLGIFVFGFYINKVSESNLKNLKRNNENEYQIPQGKFFKYVSNPHYMGELLEWFGWAVLTWSPAGLAFFCFSFANLFPRAISNHKWYKEHFSDYPASRKALIPHVV